MHRLTKLCALLTSLLVPSSGEASPDVRALLRDAQGRWVGEAELTQEGAGVVVHLRVRGLPPGTHAFHVHAVGRCDAPDFTSAGPHLNPAGRRHGLQNPDGAHMGDLPNLEVKPNGEGQAETLVRGATLLPGPHSLLGGQGTALVVHERADDHVSDPAGNAGARIACGVIVTGG